MTYSWRTLYLNDRSRSSRTVTARERRSTEVTSSSISLSQQNLRTVSVTRTRHNYAANNGLIHLSSRSNGDEDSSNSVHLVNASSYMAYMQQLYYERRSQGCDFFSELLKIFKIVELFTWKGEGGTKTRVTNKSALNLNR